MKQIFKFIGLSLALMLFSIVIFAQQDCSNPHMITTIPFSATGLSTEGMGNLFDADDLCTSNAMVNEEYIFQFTPAEDMQINIALENTEVTYSAFPMATDDANIGLFLTNKCPDEPAGTCIASVDNQTSNPSLNNINVSAGQNYFIIVSSANVPFLGGTNVSFDIKITRIVDYDLEVTSISLPNSSCSLGDEQISCVIKNNGTSNVTSPFNISFSVNGETPVVETCSSPINSDSEITYTFTNLVSFTNTGEYNIEVTIDFPLDENVNNNSLSATTYYLPTYTSFPFTEDFEAGAGFWSTGGTSSSWAYGNPSASPEDLVINSAASGQFCWITNLNGNANTNENSYIESPCYDLSALLLPCLEVNYWGDFAIYGNSASIIASADNGATWDTIANLNASENWETLIIALPNLVNETNVKFRVTFKSSFLVANGLAIDDFTIKESVLKDVGVSNIISPNTGCGLSDIETVIIEVTNHGIQAQDNIPVNYSIDGGVTWLASDEIIPSIVSEGTVQHTFTITGDFSEIGEYEIIAKTNLTGDEVADNDSFTKTVYKQNTIVVTDTYSESFETGNAGWLAYGTNSSLELAQPNGTIINQAGDGEYAWVTNPNGPHNTNETSYLESPCFDFSTLTNPIFKTMIQYETQMIMSNFYVEYSTDGIAWDTVRAGTVSNNWYGSGFMSFGTWGGASEGWLDASTEIGFLAGQSSVKFRFVFNSSSFPWGGENTEGVAIDFIRIEECADIPEAMFSFETNQLQVQFTDESTNANTWEWSFGDNAFIPSTSTEQNPSFTYSQDGQYTVSLTVTNACGVSTYETTVNVTTTNLNENYKDLTNIYPNPTSNFINIENIQNSEINIYDVNGKLVYSKFIKENKLVLDIKDWANGIYFIKTPTTSQSFIKE